EQAKNAAILRDVANTKTGELVRRQPCDRIAAKLYAALGWAHQTHDGFQRGAFADAVTPEQPDYLTRPNMQRHAVRDMAPAVIGMQILDRDQRRVICGGAHVLR